MSKYEPTASERAAKITPENHEEAMALADELCKHHAPVEEQLARIAKTRLAVQGLVAHLMEAMPPCPERSTAIAKARECLMWANAGVIFNPVSPNVEPNPFPR